MDRLRKGIAIGMLFGTANSERIRELEELLAEMQACQEQVAALLGITGEYDCDDIKEAIQALKDALAEMQQCQQQVATLLELTGDIDCDDIKDAIQALKDALDAMKSCMADVIDMLGLPSDADCDDVKDAIKDIQDAIDDLVQAIQDTEEWNDTDDRDYPDPPSEPPKIPAWYEEVQIIKTPPMDTDPFPSPGDNDNPQNVVRHYELVGQDKLVGISIKYGDFHMVQRAYSQGSSYGWEFSVGRDAHITETVINTLTLEKTVYETNIGGWYFVGRAIGYGHAQTWGQGVLPSIETLNAMSNAELAAWVKGMGDYWGTIKEYSTDTKSYFDAGVFVFSYPATNRVNITTLCDAPNGASYYRQNWQNRIY